MGWWLSISGGVLLLAGCLDRVKKQRPAIEKWWELLRETPVPDIPRIMAERTIAFAHWVRGPSWISWQSIGTTILISATLTTVAMKLGSSTSGHRIRILNTSGQFLINVYGINLVFDLATVCGTVYVLDLIRSNKGPPVVIAMAADIAIATACAVGCLTLVMFLNAVTLHDDLWTWETAKHTWTVCLRYISFGWLGNNPGVPISFRWRMENSYAATTLLPTVLYMLLLATMFAAKPVLKVARVVRHTDKPETNGPFTLFAAVIVLVGTIVTLLVLLIQEIAGWASASQ